MPAGMLIVRILISPSKFFDANFSAEYLSAAILCVFTCKSLFAFLRFCVRKRVLALPQIFAESGYRELIRVGTLNVREN